MSQGTITLTNNSTAVTGVGTAFTTDLKAGDFVTTRVNNVPYTLPVLSITSATALVLNAAYTGPTSAGVAWAAVPLDFATLIPAQLAVESSTAMRGLNLDKANWQNVFSGSANITVTLPDGSTFTGPSWNSLNTALGTKAAKGANNDITELKGLNTAITIAQGGTGATTVTLARTALGLGTAAVADVVANNADQTAGRVMTTGSNGIGGQAVNLTSVGNAWLHPLGMMSLTTASNWGGTTPTDTTGSLPAHWNIISVGVGTGQVASGARKAVIAIQSYNVGSGAPQCYVRTIHDTALSPAVMLYHTNNTTKAADGTLKAASPIVKVFHDGTYETNQESEGATVTREGVGVYRISGVLGLNSDGAWSGIDGGFDIPKDRNGQFLIWIDYEVAEEGDIIIKTYHRTHLNSPEFARNIIEGFIESQPIDIPKDQFVSVRVQMPEREDA